MDCLLCMVLLLCLLCGEWLRMDMVRVIGWGVGVQICERSLSCGQSGPTMPPVQAFVRGEMYPSGYLIRPCEGGGCILHVVDHYDNEVSGGVWLRACELGWYVVGVGHGLDSELGGGGLSSGRRYFGGDMCSLGACRTYCGRCTNRRLCLLRSRRLRHSGIFGGWQRKRVARESLGTGSIQQFFGHSGCGWPSGLVVERCVWFCLGSRRGSGIWMSMELTVVCCDAGGSTMR